MTTSSPLINPPRRHRRRHAVCGVAMTFGLSAGGRPSGILISAQLVTLTERRRRVGWKRRDARAWAGGRRHDWVRVEGGRGDLAGGIGVTGCAGFPTAPQGWQHARAGLYAHGRRRFFHLSFIQKPTAAAAASPRIVLSSRAPSTRPSSCHPHSPALVVVVVVVGRRRFHSPGKWRHVKIYAKSTYCFEFSPAKTLNARVSTVRIDYMFFVRSFTTRRFPPTRLSRVSNRPIVICVYVCVWGGGRDKRRLSDVNIGVVVLTRSLRRRRTLFWPRSLYPTHLPTIRRPLTYLLVGNDVFIAH